MNLHLSTVQWVIGAAVVLGWTAVAVWAARWVGPAIQDSPLPEPPARPEGSANHPSGRRMGCPDSIAVDTDGQLIEVWA